VFLALVIQHAKRMLHIVICGLSGSAGLFYMFHLRHDLKKKVIDNKCVFWFFSTNLSETEECSEMLLQMYTGFHGKYPLLLQILIKLEFFQPIFKKYSNIKLNEKLPSGSRDVPADGRTNGHEEANSRFTQFCEHA
jgi:hypothetical protein